MLCFDWQLTRLIFLHSNKTKIKRKVVRDICVFNSNNAFVVLHFIGPHPSPSAAGWSPWQRERRHANVTFSKVATSYFLKKKNKRTTFLPLS